MMMNIKNEVNRVGFEVVNIEIINSNIAIVIAENNNEFVTWAYAKNNNGLFGGNYFTHFGNEIEKHKEMAMKDFNKRILIERSN